MEITIILSSIIAVLGTISTLVAIRHKKVIFELKELAEVVQEALKDNKISKQEQKEIMEEVIDVAHAISESWSLKKS
jgi:hypothetical protein